MIRITIEGPQGSGKSLISQAITAAFNGQRRPYGKRNTVVYTHYEGDKINTDRMNEEDILIIEKQT